MTRKYVIWFGLVGIAAGVVLNTSMQTRQQQDRLAAVTREITAEQERIRVLTAEWHSLKTPDRLEALARRHLQGYGAIKPMQMAGLADVPDRLPEAVAAPEVNVAAAAPAAAPAVRQTASVAPPRARPASRPAARPAPAPAPQDDVAQLIARNTAPTAAPAASDDGIRTIIERDQPARGVLWASLEGAQ